MGFNEKMTSIADKIRSLTGSTDTLNFNEMDMNLETANTDKENMITSLEEMGVTVEDGASLGDIASLIPTVETGIDTSDATATADKIFKDETAYVNDEKVTGTFTIDSELTTQDDLISQITTALESKASAAHTLQDKTVSPSTSVQTVTPDSGYDGLSKVTVNAMTTATQATPSITVSSTGLITASSTQTAGYVSAGTKSATKQLTTQAAKTITPSTSSQTAVESGRYTTGAVTVAGDSNLVAGNIKSGVSIFGVAGSYEGSSGGSGSGGGSIETCSVTISIDAPISSNITFYYTNDSMEIANVALGMMGSSTINVAKNTIILSSDSGLWRTSGGVNKITTTGFSVTDSGTLMYG